MASATLDVESAKMMGGEGMDAYHTRLSSLEVHARKTEKDISALSQDIRGLVTMFQGLDKKIETLAAGKGPGIGEMIRTASSFATAGAIIAALLIYVVTSVMAAPLTTLGERQAVIQEKSVHIDNIRIDLALVNERLAEVNKRLNSGEFVRKWETNVSNAVMN